MPVVSSAPEGALFAAAAEAKASAGLGGAGGEGNGGVGKEQGGGGEDLGMDETSPSCSVSDWSGDESDGELEDGGNRVAAREGAGSGTCSVLGGDGGGDDAPSNGCGAHWGLGAGPGGRDLTQAEMRRVWNAPELGAVVEVRGGAWVWECGDVDVRFGLWRGGGVWGFSGWGC